MIHWMATLSLPPVEKGFAMRPINVVLAHHDAVSADRLAASLRKTISQSCGCKIARRKLLPQWRVCALPSPSWTWSWLACQAEASLCSEFPATAFVCIHRLADDRMWSEALAMGAVDCCHSSDLRGILMASERYVVLSRSHSAAA